MQTGFSNCWLQTEIEFPRRSKGCGGARGVGAGELLAAQVSSDVRNVAPLGWRRSTNSAAMARSYRHRINDEVSEAIAESSRAAEGQ